MGTRFQKSRARKRALGAGFKSGTEKRRIRGAWRKIRRSRTPRSGIISVYGD